MEKKEEISSRGALPLPHPLIETFSCVAKIAVTEIPNIGRLL
jgi:hypothetical protein